MDVQWTFFSTISCFKGRTTICKIRYNNRICRNMTFPKALRQLNSLFRNVTLAGIALFDFQKNETIKQRSLWTYVLILSHDANDPLKNQNKPNPKKQKNGNRPITSAVGFVSSVLTNILTSYLPLHFFVGDGIVKSMIIGSSLTPPSAWSR